MFDQVRNVVAGKPERREMLTGVHIVRPGKDSRNSYNMIAAMIAAMIVAMIVADDRGLTIET